MTLSRPQGAVVLLDTADVPLLDEVCALIAATAACRPRTLVAVDGPDAAGKTTFADRLAERLPVLLRPELRAWWDLARTCTCTCPST